MVTDKLRKYLLPNIPYVFIGWAFLKLGTAYRLAAGSDFAHKLIGLGQTVGAAFADFAPGLAPFDWLVGIVGAAAFRLLIYFKSKNAKKFRRDAEYGSARWGNEKDIKPFVDPKFENNMLLTATERLTMNTRPKNPANARNLNFCGIGSSGSGKTRFWLTPQLLQAHSSYVVVDPKGSVLGQVGTFLQNRGYKIKVFNSIDFSKSMHYNPLSYIRNEADKTIKGKISDIGRMKAEEQKKAVRAGYDMEILPPDLITFSKDAAELLADLQSRNERMFLLTFTVINLAPTRQKLENDVFTVGGIAQKYNCALRRLDWQQEQGFVSSLVLGYNGIEIQRGMTTSSTAIFIPFMTRELRMGGQALYYGMNALSHNVIMADRKKLKSANGLYLGSTGSGKSFAAKRELLNVFLTTNDRIIIVDPMGEYVPLARRLGGQIIEIAPDSPNHLNPMDIQLNLNGGDSPLSMKADFLLSLCELVLGGKEGLQPIERTVIDRCVRLVYREMALGLEPEKTPLLQDLYEELLKQPEPEAQRVATALELYCTGSLNLFNHPTNVRTDNRVVCIVLKGMGENLRKIAMHITDEFVTQAVEDNFREGVATWCYFDEFHVLLRDQLTASYFVAVWKMLRKKGCVPSALTQNVKDLLASREIEAILDNTDFMVLLSQAQSDRAILAKQLGISEHQLSYITHSNSGEGLLFYGSVTIPFVDRFPRGEIYDLLTTRPEDMAHERTDK